MAKEILSISTSNLSHGRAKNVAYFNATARGGAGHVAWRGQSPRQFQACSTMASTTATRAATRLARNATWCSGQGAATAKAILIIATSIARRGRAKHVGYLGRGAQRAMRRSRARSSGSKNTTAVRTVSAPRQQAAAFTSVASARMRNHQKTWAGKARQVVAISSTVAATARFLFVRHAVDVATSKRARCSARSQGASASHGTAVKISARRR